MKAKVIKSLYISYNAITEPIVQSQVIPYLRELSKKGIKFYLLTFEKKRMRKDEKNRLWHMLKKEFNSGLDIHWFCLNYHKRPTVPATLFDIVMGLFYSAYVIIKNKIDIVHARAIIPTLIGYPTAKLLSKKFIFDTRGIDSEEYVDAGLWRKGGFKHRVAGFLESALTKSSDHVIVLTEKFQKILKEKYAGYEIKFSVIPCAVDTDKFKLKQNKNTKLINNLKIRDKFVITYIGSLGSWYMLPEMVDFFKVASKFINNAHFLVLTQTDKNYAITAIKQKGLDMEDITVDNIAYDSMPDYLSICDLGIFFIKPVFSKLSSSPTKFAEYLASGLPVVINRGIGDTEAILLENKVGVVIKDFNENSYRKACDELMELLKDKSLPDKCRKVAEKYLSLNIVIRTYDKIYKNLAEGN